MNDFASLTNGQHYPRGALYVVATPIGNAADITLRALHVLGLVDAVACEDTRNTAQLLTRYGISRPLIAAHQHNEHAAAQRILPRLQAGERVAFVSDAGTPGISDPGMHIVEAVRAAGFPVVPLPGASAITCALSAAGHVLKASDSCFSFIGFLPTKPKQRETLLRTLVQHPYSLVFYEAPHRIADTLETLCKVFPLQRRILIARELTKLFETLAEFSLEHVTTWLTTNPQQHKGEFVLVLEGSGAEASAHAQPDAEQLLRLLLTVLPTKTAAQITAQCTGAPKNALYAQALAWKEATLTVTQPDETP